MDHTIVATLVGAALGVYFWGWLYRKPFMKQSVGDAIKRLLKIREKPAGNSGRE